MTPRIPPVEPPYDVATGAQLEAMMPAGVPPIGLFRTFVRNLEMTAAMRGWGGYELSRGLSVSLRDREIVIDRVCARCGCEYEWGVHVSFFAARARLSDEQISSLAFGSSDDACWTDEQDRALIAMVDALHDDHDLPDDLWRRLSRHFDHRQLLDLTMLTGWYHAISFTARAARVGLEPGAARFADYQAISASP
jgi:alkylhydroperoxidase family enzyme